MSNEIYAWGRGIGPDDDITDIRIETRRSSAGGLLLNIADDIQIFVDDATAIALAGLLTGGDLADDIWRTAKALQARNGSETTSAFLRRMADEIDERPEWTRRMK